MAENKVIFLIDFDVTISRKDSTDTLLETHNPEYKKIIREQYRNGDITMREFVIFNDSSPDMTNSLMVISPFLYRSLIIFLYSGL